MLILSRMKFTDYLLTPWCSPSWAANWFAASQKIPRISRNPKVHHRTHKRPPPVSILGQPNPVHIPTSHLLEIYPNITHPTTPRSPQWSFSLRFPHILLTEKTSQSMVNFCEVLAWNACRTGAKKIKSLSFCPILSLYMHELVTLCLTMYFGKLKVPFRL